MQFISATSTGNWRYYI